MKPIRHITYAALAISLLCLLMPTNSVRAQVVDDEVKSLGEILNPKVNDYAANLPVKERANIYYKKCMATESLAFDKEEKEILCACTASKMGTILTGKEFVSLYKDSKNGKEARMKLITYAYTDCMGYAINSKIYKDCRVLPIMSKIIKGKDAVCECLAGNYEQKLNESAAHMIMEGVKHHPMTLNPLEHHFTSDAYYSTLHSLGKICRSRMIYNRDN